MKRGFTVVELLIVIVVIGILATLTIIAYSGVQNQARVAAIQNDLAGVVKKAEAYRYQTSANESYPTDLTSAGIVGGSNGNTLSYSPNNTANPKLYCADATKGTTSYYVTQSNTTPQQGSCSITSGLRGWWRMNGNGNDSSGNGYNGTVSNATLTTGQNGSANAAYNFTPANSSYISLPDAAALAGDPTYTISAWYRSGSANAYGILGWGSWGTSNSVIALRVATIPGFQTYWWANDLNTPFVNGFDNQWHQVVTSYDGATMKTYADGVYINGRTPTAGHNAVATNMNIGRTNTAEYFSGVLDDVRLYNRALSDVEIQILYAAGAQ